MKPYSDACEQNKYAIFSIIEIEFKNCRNLLEIGSGTGQHAVYFAEQLPAITWQTSDKIENLVGLNAWINEAGLSNLKTPIELDVTNEWPESTYDGIFSANSLHIMNDIEVDYFFKGVNQCLVKSNKLCVYGPFNYGNNYTSKSNENFDLWLKNRDPLSGIKNFENLNSVAEKNNLEFKEDIEMPENNRILIWLKK